MRECHPRMGQGMDSVTAGGSANLGQGRYRIVDMKQISQMCTKPVESATSGLNVHLKQNVMS